MSTLQSAPQTQNLSELRPGDEFEIVQVLPCAGNLPDHRFSPGRRWRCLYRGSAVMLLVGRTRETIRIPMKSAQCVEVQRTGLHESRATCHDRAVTPSQRGE